MTSANKAPFYDACGDNGGEEPSELFSKLIIGDDEEIPDHLLMSIGDGETEQNLNSTYLGNNNLPVIQNSLLASDSADYQKISIHNQMAQIEVKKEQEITNECIRREQAKNIVRVQSNELKKMISYEVIRDSLGWMLYAPVGLNQEIIPYKILLTVRNYKAVWLTNLYPEPHRVLKVSWEDCREAIYFEIGTKGISTRMFLERLKAQGVVLRTSKRCSSEVADALLAYSLNTEEEYDIPWYLGWNRMGDMDWHFADKKETTMREVLKYV